jgi:hypothetical protein
MAHGNLQIAGSRKLAKATHKGFSENRDIVLQLHYPSKRCSIKLPSMTKFIICLPFVILALGCSEIKTSKNNDGNQAELKEKGKEITDAAFTALSSQLAKAMNEGGIPNAIDYCRTAAYPITDSIAKEYGVLIKRTALRVRNPENKPTDPELSLLKYYNGLNDINSASDTLYGLSDGSHAYARPIILQGGCIGCHGKPGSEISLENHELIRSKYPSDEAVNFAIGELRGMWVVKF